MGQRGGGTGAMNRAPTTDAVAGAHFPAPSLGNRERG